MRVLGYPPGWLKEADMSRTVVAMIDDSESQVNHTDVDKSEYFYLLLLLLSFVSYFISIFIPYFSPPRHMERGKPYFISWIQFTFTKGR